MQRHREGRVTMEADNGGLGLQESGLPAGTRSWDRGRGKILPQSLQKEPILLTSGFQTSGLLNGEKMQFCCF